MAVDSLKKVKILVLGDTGVGKSSLVHLICHKEVLSHSTWTVGCTVEVKLHDYAQSPGHTSNYFLEFWDVGGAPYHRKGRPVFFQNVNGLILVHDLTNKKTHSHLTKWLSEFHKGTGTGGKGLRASLAHGDSFGNLEYDPEQFVDQEVPLIIIGTKSDQVTTVGKTPSKMTGAASINVDCTNVRQFSLDSPEMIQLNKFFDKVIERRYFPGFRPQTMVSFSSVGGATERLRPLARRTASSNTSSET